MGNGTPSVLSCGGDGTTGWTLKVLDEAKKIRDFEYILGVIPFGSGNDFSRCVGWGVKYPGSKNLWKHCCATVKSGKYTLLDRWNVEGTYPDGSKCEWISNEMVNYFCIGIEGTITQKFEKAREEHPEYYTTPFKNKIKYMKLSASAMVKNNRTLDQILEITCDGAPIKLPSGTVSFVVNNIQSMAQGIWYWGGGRHAKSVAGELQECTTPKLGDGKFEVMCSEGFSRLAQTKIGMAHYIRLAQCSEMTIRLKEEFPISWDGEAWMEKPCTIKFTHKGKVQCAVGTIGETRGLCLTKL